MFIALSEELTLSVQSKLRLWSLTIKLIFSISPTHSLLTWIIEENKTSVWVQCAVCSRSVGPTTNRQHEKVSRKQQNCHAWFNRTSQCTLVMCSFNIFLSLSLNIFIYRHLFLYQYADILSFLLGAYVFSYLSLYIYIYIYSCRPTEVEGDMKARFSKATLFAGYSTYPWSVPYNAES